MRGKDNLLTAAALAVLGVVASAQSVELRPAPLYLLPAQVDSNTAAFWRDGQFHFFSSTGSPLLNSGNSQFEITQSEAVAFPSDAPGPKWIEAVWQDSDGTLFLWYHHEQVGLCPGSRLTKPNIGAAVSFDGGRTIRDLGIVLDAAGPIDCSAPNGYFGGGHGDFSVIFNPADGYFYFFFSNYSGDVQHQGVAVARMALEQRYEPVGAVMKYHQGDWLEPGNGGAVTPVFPAAASWNVENTDAFWGPSVHWNYKLQQYVMVLNRSCCSPGWPQEAIYISFNPDPANPAGWKAPQAILGTGNWYPTILGLGPGETDTYVGETGRLYTWGISEWEIVFLPDNPQEDPIPPPSPFSGPREPSDPR